MTRHGKRSLTPSKTNIKSTRYMMQRRASVLMVDHIVEDLGKMQPAFISFLIQPSPTWLLYCWFCFQELHMDRVNGEEFRAKPFQCFICDIGYSIGCTHIQCPCWGQVPLLLRRLFVVPDTSMNQHWRITWLSNNIFMRMKKMEDSSIETKGSIFVLIQTEKSSKTAGTMDDALPRGGLKIQGALSQKLWRT